MNQKKTQRKIKEFENGNNYNANKTKKLFDGGFLQQKKK